MTLFAFFQTAGSFFSEGTTRTRRALGHQEVGDGVLAEKIIDGACNARNLGAQKCCGNLRKDRAENRNGSAVGCDAVRPEQICRARYRAQQLTMREADLAFSRDIRRQHGQGRPVRMQPRRRLEQMIQIARGNESIVRRSLQCLDIGDRRNRSGESRRDRRRGARRSSPLSSNLHAVPAGISRSTPHVDASSGFRPRSFREPFYS